MSFEEKYIKIYVLEDSIKRARVLNTFGESIDISDLVEEAHFILGKTSGELTFKDYRFLISELMKIYPASELLN